MRRFSKRLSLICGSRLANPQITVFSLSPEKTAKEHHVHSLYRGWRHDLKEKSRRAAQSGFINRGGGGLLQDTYPTRFLFGPLPYYLLIVFLAKLCGTKVMFFSQGIGPVNSKWGKILMKVFANMADFVTVRDQYSKDLLLRLGRHPPTNSGDIGYRFCLSAAKRYSLHRQSSSLKIRTSSSLFLCVLGLKK